MTAICWSESNSASLHRTQGASRRDPALRGLARVGARLYSRRMTGITPYLHVNGGGLDPLTLKPSGDRDGQVRDRFGVTWLIGSQG